MTDDRWRGEPDAAELERRRASLERLVAAARRLGVSTERLAGLMRELEKNATSTRRFLADEVYGVPDDLLDDLVRLRLADLETDEPDGAA